MKFYQISLLFVAGLAAVSCNDIDEMDPAGDGLTNAQLKETNGLVPSRTEATFEGMFSMMGKPDGVFNRGARYRADDFGFITSAISLDAEGPDYFYPNSDYSWFSVCGELSSRNADYANPYIRYATPYNQIKIANEVLASYPENTTDSVAINRMAQAHAIRAFDYLALAPYFQFNYQIAKDKPCVPIVTNETPDFTNNPRATVEEVFKFILEDLNYAIAHLNSDRDDKAKININVAYGLRARANLIMGNWEEAAADAEKAMEGYTPASIAEVSEPAFYNINDHNWIWGIDITTDMANNASSATSSSWVSSFPADGYTAGAGCYAMINNMLYNKITATDVRKGWWVDENLHSDLLTNLTWGGVSGDAISSLKIADVKEPFEPYTNVKFGMMSGIGGTINNNDWPLMRVEEMILIQAEGYAKSGNTAKAEQILSDFVKTYRDPSYTVSDRNLTLENEIWFQRRVELWGEGFAMGDIMRLNKPLVRFHDDKTNEPTAFRFNLRADDGWLLMRFTTSEMNTNLGIIDNHDGVAPKQDQNPELRDGVTD